MKKFRNKYRIPSARLPGWDYRNAGAYFITICTDNRVHFFGECNQGKMKLSIAGMIVQGCWYQIPFLNPHVSLGAFVVMPNHVHGILILDDMENDDGDGDGNRNGNGNGDGNRNGYGNGDGDGNGVETFDSNVSTPLPNEIDYTKYNEHVFYKTISPKSGSVSRIIQQYKTVCTKHIRLACPDLDFKWQTRFYDHIIRNQQAFQNISKYIIKNPKNWIDDRFHNSSS